jgi:hypothetical protein
LRGYVGASHHQPSLGKKEGNKAPLVRLEKRRRVRKKKPVGPPPTAGKDWFDIPNTTLTPELEKTFKVLELRPYMYGPFLSSIILFTVQNFSLRYKDRHYKRSSGVKSAEIPEFFGVGTVLDDPLDFYSTRVQKKKRKQTLAEEILDDEQVRGFVARKAGAIKEKEDQLQLIRKR